MATKLVLRLTTEGILVYAAMAIYLAAAAVQLARGGRKAGAVLFLQGFAVAVAAFVVHTLRVGHVPLQSLYEVFLCLGMLAWPISAFCRRFLGVGAEWADCLIGVIVLFPVGFVRKFSPDPLFLPPALDSSLFVPHVGAYMLAYVILAKATVQAGAHLLGRKGPADERLLPYEIGTYRLIQFGFPLLTIGLVLGAVWGKIAWGDYWNWDPKELWSFVSWLVYVFYLHFRFRFGQRLPRVGSALAILGMLAIIVTLLWVNLSSLFVGQHSYATS